MKILAQTWGSLVGADRVSVSGPSESKIRHTSPCGVTRKRAENCRTRRGTASVLAMTAASCPVSGCIGDWLSGDPVVGVVIPVREAFSTPSRCRFSPATTTAKFADDDTVILLPSLSAPYRG